MNGNDTLSEMSAELARLRNSFGNHVDDDKRAFAALSESLLSLSRKLEENGRRLEENTQVTTATLVAVDEVKTLLQVGRAVGLFLRGVRWGVVWLTPIAIFVGGAYAFVQWLIGKGPFPH